MLTASQKTALKSAFLADGAVNTQPNTSDGNSFVADYYNQIASPAFIVWRTNIPRSAIKQAVNWTEYIGRTVGERSAFELLVADGFVNAADTNVRQGFTDMFSGAGGATTRTALTAVAKRSATRGEKVLSAGTGSDPSPATMGFEGALSYQDIEGARNS